MSTLKEKLNTVLNCKRDIKAAIEEKGESVLDFASYANAIRNINTSNVERPNFNKRIVHFEYSSYLSPTMNLANSFREEGITKLILCNVINQGYYPDSDFKLKHVDDLTINDITYSDNESLIKSIGKNSVLHLGNLRLEGTWDTIPEDLLDAFNNWELYLNGEHIGTITATSEEYYYYSELEQFGEKVGENIYRYYAGDGNNGTFEYGVSYYGDFIGFNNNGKPTPLTGKTVKSVVSNRGNELIDMVTDGGITFKGVLVNQPIEWVEITFE